MDATRDMIKQYILDEFLPGEDPENLTDTTPLVTGGILDSLATLKLATYLESNCGIQVQAHELTPEYLDTIDKIAHFVQAKRAT